MYNLTEEQFQELHAILSKTRGKVVKVSKFALENLLMDHADYAKSKGALTKF